MRESKNPVEGSVQGDRFVELVVGGEDVGVVIVSYGKAPWESVIAVVRAFVESCDTRTGFGVELAF